MATLDDAITIGRRERFLAVVSTVRADVTIQSSVVNAGVLAHPVTGERVVGIVTYGRAKLANLRARPQITITFRSAGPLEDFTHQQPESLSINAGIRIAR